MLVHWWLLKLVKKSAQFLSCRNFLYFTFVFILKQHYKFQNNEHFHGMSSPKYKLRSVIVCVCMHKSTFSIQKGNLCFSPRQLQGLIRALFPDFSYHYSSWLTQLLGKTTACTAEPSPWRFPSPSLDSLAWLSPTYIGNHETTIWRFPQKNQQAPSYQQLVPTPSFPYGPFVRCSEMRSTQLKTVNISILSCQMAF